MSQRNLKSWSDCVSEPRADVAGERVWLRELMTTRGHFLTIFSGASWKERVIDVEKLAFQV